MRNLIFSKDLYRWYGEKGESLKARIFRPYEIKYMYWFRKAQNPKPNIKNTCQAKTSWVI